MALVARWQNDYHFVFLHKGHDQLWSSCRVVEMMVQPSSSRVFNVFRVEKEVHADGQFGSSSPE